MPLSIPARDLPASHRSLNKRVLDLKRGSSTTLPPRPNVPFLPHQDSTRRSVKLVLPAPSIGHEPRGYVIRGCVLCRLHATDNIIASEFVQASDKRLMTGVVNSSLFYNFSSGGIIDEVALQILQQ
ncbi:MAG: hypothetical protein NTX81_08815 [Candidatus Bathyarchaeota archaeon]|nr:hypothetical protein [Candidatus Bathyarchaeota archaeon]